MQEFEYILISVTTKNADFKKTLSELKFNYQKQLYYLGSDEDYATFMSIYGFIDRIDSEDWFELIANASSYYVDEEAIEGFVGDLKMSKKINIL